MLDVLVIAPHPDDAELGMAGAILKFQEDGMRVGVLDLTDGEPTPHGSVEIRARETAEATRLLGLASGACSGALPPKEKPLAARAAGAAGKAGRSAARDCHSRKAPVINKKQAAAPARKRSKTNLLQKEIRHDATLRSGGVSVNSGANHPSAGATMPRTGARARCFRGPDQLRPMRRAP